MRPFILLISIIVLSSCTGYQKILKHGTAEEKLEAAQKYYNKKDYVRAQPLLEELMGLYFGKREREEIYYLYAYTHYGLSEYLIAGYHFRNFTKSYPLSEHREEAHYMSAICEYHKTLTYELDQTNTQMAINSLQSFINKYPNSGYVEDCNQRIDQLRSRLLRKVYTSAKLYYQIGEYKAAMVACENALDDYPDMINRDELRFLIADAAFIYANNSIKTTQEERFTSALEKCSNYFKEYKKGNAYYQKVNKLKQQAENKLNQIRQTTQE